MMTKLFKVDNIGNMAILGVNAEFIVFVFITLNKYGSYGNFILGIQFLTYLIRCTPSELF